MTVVSNTSNEITKTFLRVRYGIVTALIILVACGGLFYDYMVGKQYRQVTDDFRTIALLNTQALDAFNKVFRITNLPLEERETFASSSRTAINVMANIHAKLQERIVEGDAPEHLRALVDDQIRGDDVVLKVMERGHELVRRALDNSLTELEIYKFTTQSTAEFDLLVEKLIQDTGAEQKKLADFSLMGGSIVSSLLFLAAAGALFIFIPMERKIIASQKELDLRAQRLEEEGKRAEAADAAKSMFLANMSHEIRTPMNGIMGMAQLMARTELTPKQQTFTDIIVKSGSSLLTIINDILDFSKIDAGHLELDPEPFDPGRAIEDVAALMSARAAEKNLQFAVRMNMDLPRSVIGDVGRFRQIVTNLVGNAIKFTDDGHVLIEMSGTVDDDTANIRINVTDTGIGIPEDKCKRVFEKFSQVDESATRKHDGTGLGLSISSSLVELMDGQIGVDSVLEQGSTFWFEIPFMLAKRDADIPSPWLSFNRQRILVVDDHALSREIVTEKLAAWNLDSAAAANVHEAIQLLRFMHDQGMSLDAAIINGDMPDLVGLELVESIRSEPAYSTLPIILSSSYDLASEHPQLSMCRIQDQLLKPIRNDDLNRALDDSLKASRDPSVLTSFDLDNMLSRSSCGDVVRLFA
ncbi:MAG: response regulator [Rhizobiaceae bacterium]|nr:response regulator [Rhizobiaceae bacterium]